VKTYAGCRPPARAPGRAGPQARDFRSIPNLLYKADGEVQATGFTHKPAANYNNARND
jgi:hypothetical protein